MTHFLDQLGPGVAVGALVYALRQLILRADRRRQLRRTPAAPDNQPGRDMGLLQECRLIATTEPASRKEKP
jgi:hypothetical protein